MTLKLRICLLILLLVSLFLLKDNFLDTEAPEITDITIKNKVVSWQTNEPSTAIYHVATIPANLDLDQYSKKIETLSTSHSIALKNISPCSKYYFKITGIDDHGNKQESKVDSFITSGCNRGCFDKNPFESIHIRNIKDALDIRKRIIKEIWHNDYLPRIIPKSIREGLAPDEIPQFTRDRPSITNFVRDIDEITVSIKSLTEPLENKYLSINTKPFKSLIYHIHPSDKNNNRLMIIHQGHQGGILSGSLEIVAEEFLKLGYSVLLMSMPIHGNNTGPFERINDKTFYATHNAFVALEAKEINPLAFFLEPVAQAVNYIEKNYDYESISMMGLSGGGWTTMFYSSIDPRIQNSFPVAGSLPLFATSRNCYPDRGHYESGGAFANSKPIHLYKHIASLLDLYILATVGNNRSTTQIHNLKDSCCYGGYRVNLYKDHLKYIVAKLPGNGKYNVFVDDSRKDRHHTVTNRAIKLILDTIDSNS